MVYGYGGQSGKNGSGYSTPDTDFKAPTTGLTDVFFTAGMNEDAANFIETKKRLARHVGTCNYRGAATASLVIETMEPPIFKTSKRPDEPSLTDKDGKKISDGAEKLALINYQVVMSDYIDNQKETRIEERDWKENGPKLWNLVLSHCPKTVTLKLEAQPGYEVQALARDPIKLLIMLRDIAQSFDATKDATMSIVESDVRLYLGFQGKKASIDEYATLYRSRIDTIKAHGGEPGYHPAQQSRVLSRELKTRGMTDTEYAAMKGESKVAFDNEIIKLARGEYFACLFVRQTDAVRYGELKKTIINDYLRGGPDCPKTLEAAIILFKNYQPTTTERQAQKQAVNTPGTSEQVAFVQQYSGGYRPKC